MQGTQFAFELPTFEFLKAAGESAVQLLSSYWLNAYILISLGALNSCFPIG